MRYNDYMNQFTVIDETKGVISSRMKQRARQLKTARVERAASVAEAKVKAEKKNTFKLHPRRWIAILTSIALVAVTTPIVCILASRNGGNGGTSVDTLEPIKLEYMDNLMVETEGVTAYSIRKETREDGPSTTSLKIGENSKNTAISLLSATLVEDDIKPLAGESKSYSYLYSTTEDYEPGNVEYDEHGIQKVTFMKNKEVTEDVYDQNGNLIDSNRKITQEELDAQITKIYTTKRFTFIQFAAKVEESGYYNYRTPDGEVGEEWVQLRPDGLKYDANGVTYFDSSQSGAWGGYQAPGAYYSNHLMSAFVIDNETGYIYKIEDLIIYGFSNDVIIAGMEPDSSRSYVSVNVDENNNLVFADIMPNEDVNISRVFLDSYGWIYVYNSSIDAVDSELKVIYFTQEDQYVWGSDGYAYVLGNSNDMPTHRMVDGEAVTYDRQGLLRYKKWRGTSEYTVIYDEFIVNTKANILNEIARTVTYPYLFIQAPVAIWYWVDNNYDMLIAIDDTGTYFKSIHWSDIKDSYDLSLSEFTKLTDLKLEKVDNYYINVGDDEYRIDDVYRYVSATETKHCRILKTETGLELVELTSKSYDSNIFIFQPINK